MDGSGMRVGHGSTAVQVTGTARVMKVLQMQDGPRPAGIIPVLLCD
jgi:hypothetical protein